MREGQEEVCKCTQDCETGCKRSEECLVPEKSAGGRTWVEWRQDCLALYQKHAAWEEGVGASEDGCNKG